jgi:hypothetical protein
MAFDIIFNPVFEANHIVQSGQLTTLCGFDVDYSFWLWMKLRQTSEQVEQVIRNSPHGSRMCEKCLGAMKNRNSA